MNLTWDTKETWFDRTYSLEHNGGTVEAFGEQPTLRELPEASRRYGQPTERLHLWQAGLLCTECGEVINDRFCADPEGNLRCRECATVAQGGDQHGTRVNTDQTKAVISESQLHTKSLCDYVINVVTGCRHGCKFCYVPTTPAVTGEAFYQSYCPASRKAFGGENEKVSAESRSVLSPGLVRCPFLPSARSPRRSPRRRDTASGTPLPAGSGIRRSRPWQTP